jgi:hypothetical protein
MIFSQILWLQLALVGTGALLQIIAMCTFARDPHVHDGMQSHADENNEHTEHKTSLPATPPPAAYYHPQMVHHAQNDMADLHPASLAKTKKVSFKQEFRGLH